jgi:hypothetical protein
MQNLCIAHLGPIDRLEIANMARPPSLAPRPCKLVLSPLPTYYQISQNGQNHIQAEQIRLDRLSALMYGQLIVEIPGIAPKHNMI